MQKDSFRTYGLPLGLFVGSMLVFGFGSARAHDAWWNGKEVDPSTRRYCCGENDVKHLTREEVRVTTGGYRLEDTGETVPFRRVQPSPDGEFWVFRWGGQTQCFFAPPDGA
jgi:hypothetical protein